MSRNTPSIKKISDEFLIFHKKIKEYRKSPEFKQAQEEITALTKNMVNTLQAIAREVKDVAPEHLEYIEEALSRIDDRPISDFIK